MAQPFNSAATAAGTGGRWRGTAGLLLAAAGVFAGGVFLLAIDTPRSTPPAAQQHVLLAARSDTPAVALDALPAPPPSIAATVLPAAAPVEPAPESDPTPDITAFINRGEVPTMAEVISRLHAAGVFDGLGAFQPPGTRPPLIGLAVPEDFVLPVGFVRHHQATDDGQAVEAILMFSPDYRFVDGAGNTVAIPPDRVVPPEFAPPGLPLRRIVIPAPLEPGRPGR
jgi:hypothetical protein